MLRKINIFLVLGILLMLGVVAFGGNEAYFRMTGKTAIGKIVRIDKTRHSGKSPGYMYTPVVDYKLPGGKTQEFSLGYSSSFNFYSVNQQVPVLYDPNKPDSAIISTDPGQWFIFGALGLLGVGFMFAGISIRKAAPPNPKLKAELLQNGRRIDTAIVSNGVAFAINRQPIWEIKSTYTEGGKTYKFHSEGLNFDVSAIINAKGIRTIPVWVDPTDMKKYYMAAEELQKLSTKPKTDGTTGSAPTPAGDSPAPGTKLP